MCVAANCPASVPDITQYRLGIPRSQGVGVGALEPETFGEQLRRRRHRAGMSQAELAAAAGVDVSTISRWERGKSEGPSPLAQARIEAALVGSRGLVREESSADDAGPLADLRRIQLLAAELHSLSSVVLARMQSATSGFSGAADIPGIDAAVRAGKRRLGIPSPQAEAEPPAEPGTETKKGRRRA